MGPVGRGNPQAAFTCLERCKAAIRVPLARSPRLLRVTAESRGVVVAATRAEAVAVISKCVPDAWVAVATAVGAFDSTIECAIEVAHPGLARALLKCSSQTRRRDAVLAEAYSVCLKPVCRCSLRKRHREPAKVGRPICRPPLEAIARPSDGYLARMRNVWHPFGNGHHKGTICAGPDIPALCAKPFSYYIAAMTKAHLVTTETTVRDSKSGRTLKLRGAGALKGQLTLRKNVDLTKPIASQAMKGGVKTRKAADAHPKH